MKSLRFAFLRFALMGVVIAVAGCGGGGGGGDGAVKPASHTNSAAGLYSGSATSSIGYSDNVIGIIAENGQAFVFTGDSGLYAGVISGTDGTVSGNLTGYAPAGYTFSDGSTVAPITLNGTLQPKNSLMGNVSGGGMTGAFSLAYSPEYEEDSSLAKIAGNYGRSNASIGYTISISIDSTGLVTGSDTDGCVYNGHIKLMNPDYNIYAATVSASSCGELDGNYKGMATLLDANSLDNVLLVGVSNDSHAAAEVLTRL